MILDKPVNPTFVKGLLKNKFLQVARESLLFLNMGRVEVQVQSSHGIEALWSVTSLQADPNEKESKKANRVATLIDEAGIRTQELWYIVNSTLPRDGLPEEFKILFDSYRVPKDIKTGIAAHLPTGPLDSVQRQQYIYSTLRLPIPISLPVHLNAPFILAPDRRSIRFDGVGQLNLESQFNHWLLVQLIPPLYCRLLADVKCDFQETLWPGNSSIGNEDPSSLTSIVTDAFFKYFSGSRQPLCWTTSDRQMPPQSSRFTGDFPDSIYQLLSLLRLDDVVIISNRRVRSRILGSGVQKIGRDELFPILKGSSDKLLDLFMKKELKIEDIWSILQYLATEGCNGPQLDGICMLPLGDKSLGHLSSTEARVFVRSEYPKRFPKQRFVNRHIPQRLASSLIKLNLNVSWFDNKALQELVMKQIPKVTRMELTEKEKKWVDSLWDLGEDIDKKSLLGVSPLLCHLVYIGLGRGGVFGLLSLTIHSPPS
jgi:hypothetical protein